MKARTMLIADSGSTKTDWRLISSEGSIKQHKTAGTNPFMQKEEELLSVFEKIGKWCQFQELDLHFYGAGCTGEKASLMKGLLQQALPSAHISVYGDLLAAARATCQQDAGIACILGTGANSCQYDGENIVDHIPALGYVLGDEGSGAVMGKNLVSAYFKRSLPERLSEKFAKRYALTEADLLEQVYKKPFPNRYLASFTRFLHHNLADPWVFRFVYDELCLFFERNVQKYEDYERAPVHFVGSIAFYFSNVLRRAAQDKGCRLGTVLETPIAGLALFHKESAQWSG